MRKIFQVLPLVVMLGLTGCVNLAPETEKPSIEITQAWPKGEAYKLSETKREALPMWDEFFTDARLREVIETALSNNKDLRIAALNVEKARALYGIQRADMFPTVAAAAAGQHQKTPSSLSPIERESTSHQYTAQLALAKYEFDFFGKIRNLNEQALQNYLASDDARRSARNTLIAETALVWYRLGADEAQLKLQREVLKTQEESFALIEASFELGAVSELDYEQAKSTVSAARASIESYVRAVAQDKNALNLIVGKKIDNELLPTDIILDDVAPVRLPDGLPSEVLLNRPDIAQAERGMIVANANIGVARAAFFPSISISAGVGTGATEVSSLFDSGTGLWNFVPQVSLPIFMGGRNIANLKAAQASQKIAATTYEKTIELAFKEVADALATEGTIENELSARADYALSSEKAFKLTESRYKLGAVPYIDVLNSQRAFVMAEQQLLSTKLARIASQITMFKVLGAGAVEEPKTGE